MGGGGGSLSISQPYEPSMIKEFWQGTSDDVKMYVHAHTKPVQREGLPYSTFEAAARVERSELLSRENIKRLSRQERECLDSSSADELEGLLQKHLDHAIKRQEVAKDKRNKLKRAANKTSDFLVAFHGYVEAYSGVIQIMNGAPGAGGYGNAAYAALSLFLMVKGILI